MNNFPHDFVNKKTKLQLVKLQVIRNPNDKLTYNIQIKTHKNSK